MGTDLGWDILDEGSKYKHSAEKRGKMMKSIPGNLLKILGKSLEKSWNFISAEKLEPCLMLASILEMVGSRFVLTQINYTVSIRIAKAKF